MERKRKAKKRKGKARQAKADVGETERLVCLKRETWAQHCIPTAERMHLLEEIKYWLGRTKTYLLPEVLGLIANRCDDDVQKTPLVRMKLRDNYDPRKGGCVILPEREEDNDPNGVRVALDLVGPNEQVETL